MASDGLCEGALNFSGFSLSIAVDTREDAGRFFSALATAEPVEMPLAETFWAPLSGALLWKRFP
ncbi:MAG: hypothetical protein SVU69_07330 [Pseudomonadota bacterium]|nr:hypothetical protein [Pseudomonadota bacterium]